jgi:predicted lipoprotein with Yx(FWY)xxD motif
VLAAALVGAALLALSATVHAAGGTAVKTRHNKLGTYLVDGQGRTLYLFQKDTTKSKCSGACAQNWPPVTTTGNPSGAGGVRKALLGTIKRSDGKTQVTYGGHPLYTYVGDSKPGDTNGQGLTAFGARWYAIGAGGRRLGAHY